jgi:23S rRNA pseudouridine1911/1915/1917 synthase
MPQRSFIITRQQAGRPLLEVLRGPLRLSRLDALRCLQQRQVRLDGRPCMQPQRQVRAGQRVEVHLSQPQAPAPRQRPQANKPAAAKAPALVIRHVDAETVVVDKPAGLTTVRHAEETAEFGTRARRFLPPTLVDLLPAVLAQRGIKGGRLRAVHRLDKETSGLLVLARTAAAERALGQQFRSHAIARVYVALVRGRAREQRIESYLVRDRGDGRRGSGTSAEGQHAVTHVRVLEELGAYTLVECRLETGRTHQVRIHLGEAGTPLCGERIYDRPLHGKPVPDASGARRPMLHAASLEFQHPDGTQIRCESPLPRDMKELLARCRKSAHS